MNYSETRKLEAAFRAVADLEQELERMGYTIAALTERIEMLEARRKPGRPRKTETNHVES